jgi:hypothetical protein
MINCRSTDDYIDIHQKRNTVKVLMLESWPFFTLLNASIFAKSEAFFLKKSEKWGKILLNVIVLWFCITEFINFDFEHSVT